jgi:radical SAM protein with 4Fe4S-binding SPASM domain
MKVHKYKDFIVQEDTHYKLLRSRNANYNFDKRSGVMVSWGETKKDDAEKFPAPTIADIEITTNCEGVGGKVCEFCFKSNTPYGKNMTFEKYKLIFSKLPKSITQIAFGADSKAKTNPDIWKIMSYTKENGMVPNISLAEVDKPTAVKLSSLCGSVAVSRYENKDICYDSIERLIKAGMKKVNLHMMISDETYDQAVETIYDIAEDPRLKDLNSIVFLSLKTKGRGKKFHILSQKRFNSLVKLCNEKEISYGFDSCSSLKYYRSMRKKEYEEIKKFVFPCESSLESFYVNVDGEFFPCSFAEGEGEWRKGLELKLVDSFIDEVWNHPKTELFRKKLLATTSKNIYNCRSCPLYKI